MTRCYYDTELCEGNLWECQTCGQRFCQTHWHETDLGRNVECVACERQRKTPTPSDEVENSYECELCGKPIPRGQERRMKDGETILCSECAKQQPDDHFL